MDISNVVVMSVVMSYNVSESSFYFNIDGNACVISGYIMC